MDKVIERPDQISPEWLTDLLHTAGVLKHGVVTSVDKSLGPPAASVILHLAVTYSSDVPKTAPARLVLKLPKTGEMRSGDKEAEFYRRLAPGRVGLPILQCYAVAVSPGSGRYNLLLEDLSDTHFSHPPAQLPPLQVCCEQIVDALAALHAHWWDDPGLGVTIGAPPAAEAVAYKNQLELIFPRFADYLGDRLPTERRKIFEAVLSSPASLHSTRYVEEKNITLVHGDVHIGNFLYPRSPQDETVRILDWKSWGISLGVEDLAHLMALFWFPERRARLEIPLLKRYHTRLLARGVLEYDWETLWRDYRLSVIGFLGYPVWQWAQGLPPDIWWHHLERIILAYQDLGCAELLVV